MILTPYTPDRQPHTPQDEELRVRGGPPTQSALGGRREEEEGSAEDMEVATPKPYGLGLRG